MKSIPSFQMTNSTCGRPPAYSAIYGAFLATSETMDFDVSLQAIEKAPLGGNIHHPPVAGSQTGFCRRPSTHHCGL